MPFLFLVIAEMLPLVWGRCDVYEVVFLLYWGDGMVSVWVREVISQV